MIISGCLMISLRGEYMADFLHALFDRSLLTPISFSLIIRRTVFSNTYLELLRYSKSTYRCGYRYDIFFMVEYQFFSLLIVRMYQNRKQIVTDLLKWIS